MFDILVYLYESYFHADFCPATEELADSLSAAGFEKEEISSTLDWFATLRAKAQEENAMRAPMTGSVRIYDLHEQNLLSTECRGYLSLLENNEILTSAQRELVIDAALALEGWTITLRRLKVIVLMVLWQHAHPTDILMVDELLNEAVDSPEQPWQPAMH